MTADDIIAAARACLGTRFQHQGRIPGLALDCAGLLIQVAKTVGVECCDQQGYSRSPSEGLLERALDNQAALQRVSGRQPGDVLVMRFSGRPQHLAVCAVDTIIHAYAQVGKVCEHALDAEWESRIVRIYRFRGLQ